MVLEVFNFDHPECWSRVLKVKDDARAQRALNAGTAAIAKQLGLTWNQNVPPWRYSQAGHENTKRLEELSPGPDDPSWFRAFGHCQALAPWCATIGSLLFPSSGWQWHAVYNNDRPHAAGVGANEEKHEIIIVDILWGVGALEQGTWMELLEIVTQPCAVGYSALEATENLERYGLGASWPAPRS